MKTPRKVKMKALKNLAAQIKIVKWSTIKPHQTSPIVIQIADREDVDRISPMIKVEVDPKEMTTMITIRSCDSMIQSLITVNIMKTGSLKATETKDHLTTQGA